MEGKERPSELSADNYQLREELRQEVHHHELIKKSIEGEERQLELKMSCASVCMRAVQRAVEDMGKMDQKSLKTIPYGHSWKWMQVSKTEASALAVGAGISQAYAKEGLTCLCIPDDSSVAYVKPGQVCDSVEAVRRRFKLSQRVYYGQMKTFRCMANQGDDDDSIVKHKLAYHRGQRETVDECSESSRGSCSPSKRPLLGGGECPSNYISRM
eukprot:Em0673g3a